MKAAGLVLVLVGGLAASRPAVAGWYVGMDNILFRPYDGRMLWSHTDLPLECDQWFPGHLELNDSHCRPKSDIYVNHPESFHSNSLFHGLHAGYRWSHFRLELEYYFREHHAYERMAPFHRAGTHIDVLGYDDEDHPWRRGLSQELYFSVERIAEVWAHCSFLNVYYNFEGLPGPLLPYVGMGAGWAYQHVYYWGLLQRSHDEEAIESLGEPAAAAGTLTMTYNDLYDHNWAYQFVLGMDWNMRPKVQLGLKVGLMDIPGEFSDSASFRLLRSHESLREPGARPEYEEPIQYTLQLNEWRTWRFALNVKALF